MTKEAYVFTRRTPRALNFHASSTRPMNMRKAGTQQRSIKWRDLDQGLRVAGYSRGLIKSLSRSCDRRTLELDLERLAGVITFDGATLEYIPGSPMFNECIKITLEDE